MRVLAFCDYFSASSSGGAERVAFETYQRLVKWGAEVLVMSACPPRMMSAADDGGLDVRRVEARDLTPIIGAQLAIAPRLGRAIATALGEFTPTVAHTHGLHFQSSVVAARAVPRAEVPLITTAHIASPEHLPLAVRAATTTYERTVGRYVLGRSHHVIAVSDAVAAHMRGLGVKEQRLSVVANGVDHDRFFPSRADEAHAKPTIAFVGRLIENKGPIDFVLALRAVASRGVACDVLVVGDGPSRNEIERIAAEAGLEITMTGHVTNVEDHLRRIDVLVRPSTTEGMSLAVLEAMASRVCVIASDVPGNNELLRDGRGVLTPVGDVDALGAAIARCATDAEFRERTATAAFEFAQGFSWDRCAAETAAVLQRVSTPVR